MASLRDSLIGHTPLTVGALTDRKALSQCYHSSACDLIELRLDALGHGAEIVDFARRQQATLPLLLTARGPQEGGLNELPPQIRREALKTLLPFASAIDIELSSLEDLHDVWQEAETKGILRLSSFHDFQDIPPNERILSLLDKMAECGADVAKIAFQLSSEEDLLRLSTVARQWGRLPLSFMGMGTLGPASRVLAVLSGSAFNYGFLGSEATAPGQWPAPLLKEVIACSPTNQSS